MPHSWTESANGHLWRLVQRVDLVVTWIPSHETQDAIVALGYSPADWAGNSAADLAAGEHVITLVLAPGAIQHRNLQLQALGIVHHVISAVEETVLTCHHAPTHPIAQRRKRQRRLVVKRRKRRARLRPAPPAQPATTAQCRVHALAFGHGPLQVTATSHGNLSWPLHCTACRKSVTGSGRWRAFATSLCTAVQGAIHLQRSFECHELIRCAGGWYCARCRLAVSSSRHASANRARCPVPAVCSGAGLALPAAMAAYCANVAALAAWRAWASAPVLVVALEAPPAAIAPAAGPLLVWRAHWRVRSQDNNNVQDVCIRCGALSTRRTPRRVESSACTHGAPVTALRGAALAALLAGSLDAALTAAPASWVVQATLLGWSPLRGG
jgi:hypothetical protein